MNNKKELTLENKKSNLSLEDRKKLWLTGVLEVLGFNEEKISVNTNLGLLIIKGEGLKMNKLDVQNGEVIISGYVYSLNYIGKKSKKNFFPKILGR
ncbi:sporulation protein YabP [Clostridium tarantellae]|uniref:Sporulation protein YabP n=1 Tax=Clostridium tarantellae TaxID=39493 RepID=A0A6I1MFA1_9CLOT|nr:sporulation protein YabP [Clostridium tarantellae]MPQ42166.1 sporulation protein YabP [Clostridium tarantellae]